MCGLGITLALGVFMADALRTLPQGLNATRQVLPVQFPWPVFCACLAMMAAPVAQLAFRGRGLTSHPAVGARLP
jgi:hypothetical protein